MSGTLNPKLSVGAQRGQHRRHGIKVVRTLIPVTIYGKLATWQLSSDISAQDSGRIIIPTVPTFETGETLTRHGLNGIGSIDGAQEQGQSNPAGQFIS